MGNMDIDLRKEYGETLLEQDMGEKQTTGCET